MAMSLRSTWSSDTSAPTGLLLSRRSLPGWRPWSSVPLRGEKPGFSPATRPRLRGCASRLLDTGPEARDVRVVAYPRHPGRNQVLHEEHRPDDRKRELITAASMKSSGNKIDGSRSHYLTTRLAKSDAP